MFHKMRVAVIGCGIGGLSFSIGALMQSNSHDNTISVHLFDEARRASWHEPTGEVSIADGEALFCQLQLGDDSTWANLQRTLGIAEMPWPPRRHERVPRSALLQALHRNVVDLGGSIHWGHALSSLSFGSDDMIACEMMDGSVRRGFDLVVGADGLLSTVRQISSYQPELARRVALVGDARRHFGLEYDLGMARVVYGASRAMHDGLELAQELTLGCELSPTSKFAFLAHEEARKRTVMLIRVLLAIVAVLPALLGVPGPQQLEPRGPAGL